METSKSEKINSHLYTTKTEINDLYAVECTVTGYNESTRSFQSLMNLPMADFSNMMIAMHIPNLSPADLNRIFNLQNMANQKIDRLLCSEHTNSIRLLASETLSTCQKSLKSETYICTRREIQLKMPFIPSCQNITSLPRTLAIEDQNDVFFIDNMDDELPIFCEGTLLQRIGKTTGPVRIKIPPSCHILSRTLTIKPKKKTRETSSIKITKTDLNILPLEMTKWKPFKQEQSEATNLTDALEKPDEDDKQEAIENDLKMLADDLNSDERNDQGMMNTTLIVLVTIAIIIGVILSIEKIRQCKSRKRYMQKDITGDAERLIKELNYKVINMQFNLENQQKQIDRLKIDFLTDKIETNRLNRTGFPSKTRKRTSSHNSLY